MINSDQRLSQYFKEVNAVFHCAALPNVQFSIDYPYESNNSNVDTTIKILECMRQNNVTKIIYSSSSSVYGNCEHFPTNEKENIKPISPYALQKYIGEEYIYLYNKLYNINYVILRYFNVYGERMTSTGSYVS
ncbi:MAG: NAD-dependent epimerase/dehydratase family protein, partial [Alphaproteobacteria bacterium]|nr:NAD-dependent epimerase/dehydratase family protein [Alphaproteobacteria bacterium]